LHKGPTLLILIAFEEDEIPIAWLGKKITVEQAGLTNDEKAEMCPGDELWTFRSPPDSWQLLAGRAGIALVRDEKPIRTIITLMN
jgi:hypothetical protein